MEEYKFRGEKFTDEGGIDNDDDDDDGGVGGEQNTPKSDDSGERWKSDERTR